MTEQLHVQRRPRSAAASRPEATPRSAAGASRPKPAPRPVPPKAERSQTLKVLHDTVNERVLLATAIVSPELRKKLVATLPADGFHGKGHAPAWAGLIEIERRGLHYDPATMRQIMGADVDTAMLDALVAERPAVPPNLPYHVECFLWDMQRIQAAKGPVSALLEALTDPFSDADRVRALAEAVGGAFKGKSGLRFLRDGKTVQAEMMRRIDARRAGAAIWPYGLDGLDRYPSGDWRMIPGMEPGLTTAIVGLSGSGKTLLSNQIVLAQANMGRRVLHGAWEQDAPRNLELLAAFSLKISRYRLRTGQISQEERDALRTEAERLSEFVQFFDLPFDQQAGQKRRYNEESLDVIHRHVADSGCEIAIFDLWKRCLVDTDPGPEERALWRQQAIAKATRTHNVLLHHLRGKDVEQRADKRPTREAIKGSGAWIDVFDTIIATHRPALWKNVPDDTLEVSVLKQRDGVWPLAVALDHDSDTGVVSGGRPIDYEQPGETRREGGFDSFLDEGRDEAPRRGRRRG